jgi:hypothetical protein
MEIAEMQAVLVQAVLDLGSIKPMQLMETADAQGWSRRDLSRAIQRAISAGEIELGPDMDWVPPGCGTGLWC